MLGVGHANIIQSQTGNTPIITAIKTVNSKLKRQSTFLNTSWTNLYFSFTFFYVFL